MIIDHRTSAGGRHINMLPLHQLSSSILLLSVRGVLWHEHKFPKIAAAENYYGGPNNTLIRHELGAIKTSHTFMNVYKEILHA